MEQSLTVQSVHGAQSVCTFREVYERIVLEFLDALDTAFVSSRTTECLLQSVFSRRQHQVAYVQNTHLSNEHTTRCTRVHTPPPITAF